MCGIFGYSSKEQSEVIEFQNEDLVHLMEISLARGSDSCGYAMFPYGSTDLHVVKATDLRMVLFNRFYDPNQGAAMIGHTRAATTGEVSNANAHPLTRGFNQKEDLQTALVHNGWTRSNHFKLGAKLGLRILRSVDSDIWGELWHVFHDDLDAFVKQSKNIDGAAALACITNKRPNEIFLFKRDNPIYLGYMENTIFFASQENFLKAVFPEILTAKMDNNTAIVLRDGLIVDGMGVPKKESKKYYISYSGHDWNSDWKNKRKRTYYNGRIWEGEPERQRKWIQDESGKLLTWDEFDNEFISESDSSTDKKKLMVPEGYGYQPEKEDDKDIVDEIIANAELCSVCELELDEREKSNNGRKCDYCHRWAIRKRMKKEEQKRKKEELDALLDKELENLDLDYNEKVNG